MDEKGSVSCWITALQAGDQQAAQKLWEAYWPRLVGLARRKLSGTNYRTFDEEDVVQSAMRSFYQRAEQGKFPELNDRNELWSLLVTITARKSINRQRHAHRAKRDIKLVKEEAKRESSESDTPMLASIVGDEPSPEFAASFVETMKSFMYALDDPTHRVIVLWKLEGRTNPEIAKHLDCSLSAVERKLRMIRTLLQSKEPEV